MTGGGQVSSDNSDGKDTIILKLYSTVQYIAVQDRQQGYDNSNADGAEARLVCCAVWSLENKTETISDIC